MGAAGAYKPARGTKFEPACAFRQPAGQQSPQFQSEELALLREKL